MSDTQTPEDTQTVAMQPQPATDSSSQQETSKTSNTKPAKKSQDGGCEQSYRCENKTS